ncbi:hypothetical protein [Bremerella alba]|uniref:Uncharacterized protein n=1 Tax=Bremerella alba TaxID=980252 RepID=A0A7V8V8B2_9BACT|nr:hypothetical protein [Bremerella alba]MBA2116731.1 hypothetical protein [Bremerella alba]
MENSAHIRKLLSEKPDLSPKELQEQLAERGIEVTRNLCKVVRHRKLNGKKRKQVFPEKLRFNERWIEDDDIIIRLTQKDLVVWDFLKKHAISLYHSSPPLSSYQFTVELENLQEVRAWIADVTSQRSRRRRLAILKYFIDGLNEPEKSFHRTQFSFRDDRFRLERPLREPMVPSIRKSEIKKRSASSYANIGVLSNDKAKNELNRISHQHSQQHPALWRLFRDDQDVTDWLLSLGAWYRYHAIISLTKSYTVQSTLHDLVELAYSTSKTSDLPKILRQLHSVEPEDSAAAKFRNHPEIANHFFLLGLWATRRINISLPNEAGDRRILIGDLWA